MTSAAQAAKFRAEGRRLRGEGLLMARPSATRRGWKCGIAGVYPDGALPAIRAVPLLPGRTSH